MRSARRASDATSRSHRKRTGPILLGRRPRRPRPRRRPSGGRSPVGRSLQLTHWVREQEEGPRGAVWRFQRRRPRARRRSPHLLSIRRSGGSSKRMMMRRRTMVILWRSRRPRRTSGRPWRRRVAASLPTQTPLPDDRVARSHRPRRRRDAGSTASLTGRAPRRRKKPPPPPPKEEAKPGMKLVRRRTSTRTAASARSRSGPDDERRPRRWRLARRRGQLAAAEAQGCAEAETRAEGSSRRSGTLPSSSNCCAAGAQPSAQNHRGMSAQSSWSRALTRMVRVTAGCSRRAGISKRINSLKSQYDDTFSSTPPQRKTTCALRADAPAISGRRHDGAEGEAPRHGPLVVRAGAKGWVNARSAVLGSPRTR